jgi:hypothetical protein
VSLHTATLCCTNDPRRSQATRGDWTLIPVPAHGHAHGVQLVRVIPPRMSYTSEPLRVRCASDPPRMSCTSDPPRGHVPSACRLECASSPAITRRTSSSLQRSTARSPIPNLLGPMQRVSPTPHSPSPFSESIQVVFLHHPVKHRLRVNSSCLPAPSGQTLSHRVCSPHLET